MDQDPNITFIICTYNRASYLDDTLHSLFQQKINDSYIEILIVDNNSEDDTKAIAEAYMAQESSSRIKVSYCVETQQGLSYARNHGIAEAKADNVVFLDDDILLGKSFIGSWLTFFKEFTDYSAAGGKIHVQFDAGKPKWASHFLMTLFGYHDLGKKVRKYPSNKYPFGGNMGFRKEIFSQTGVFDTELGRKGKNLTANEEKDLFNRVKALGEPILYLPDAFLFHRIGKERATRDYIRKQAEGMGKSIAIQVNDSVKRKANHIIKELAKTLISFALFLVYTLGLTPSKGITLLKFRYWILRGYISHI